MVSKTNIRMTPYYIIHLSEAISTSNTLASYCLQSSMPEYSTVFADYQTSGRGQRGNAWESEANKNLLFSLLLYPTSLDVRRQFLISKAVACGIKSTLDSFSEGFSIKWPNDIYWENKKICGVLIENELCGSCIKQCIVGVGLNINQTTFHSAAPNPVSLAAITGKTYEREPLLLRFLDGIVQAYRQLMQGGEEALNTAYFQALYRRDGMFPYRVKHGLFMARIIDVRPEGTFILRDENGVERGYAFKEVAFL
jgi:BirA family biotin operon repressor/biotin-[acetyl-CoA-carboxylase] ligase